MSSYYQVDLIGLENDVKQIMGELARKARMLSPDEPRAAAKDPAKTAREIVESRQLPTSLMSRLGK